MDPAPCKRKRSDSEAEAAEKAALQPSPGVRLMLRSSVWYDDGNIIVQAETTRFRVYGGALAFHSPVLKAIVDSLDENSPTADGCRIVHVSDAALDVEEVLKKLFHQCYSDNDPLSFHTIAAFARIGRSWEIPSLFENAVLRLSSVFPSNHEMITRSNNGRYVSVSPEKWFDLLYGTIALAHELDIPILLPAAFLFLCSSDAIANALPFIPIADAQAILFSFNWFQKGWADFVYEWFDGDFAECTGREMCRFEKHMRRKSLCSTKPLCSENIFMYNPQWAAGLCRPCAIEGRRRHAELGKAMWTNIPAAFGLPSWTSMLKGSSVQACSITTATREVSAEASRAGSMETQPALSERRP
ncbi:F-box domain-containing protein [Mycena kentingensis (nom. inval.)]|nr:F-box domain-containing protein [Mycena kentingensis (nom. inval.)]